MNVPKFFPRAQITTKDARIGSKYTEEWVSAYTAWASMQSPTSDPRHRHRQLGLSGSLALICSLQLLDLSLTGGDRTDPRRGRALDRLWYPSSAPLHRLQPHRSSYAKCRCQWTSPIRSTMSLNGVSVGGSWCYVVSLPATTGALGCQLASLIHVSQAP